MADVLELELTKRSNKYFEDVSVLSKFYTEKDIRNEENPSDLDVINLIGELGFTNSKCIVEKTRIMKSNQNFNDAVKAAVESLAFIMEVREYFGKNTIVVKREDMLRIMRKYDLVCGEFSNYTETVPSENALEIKNAKDKIREIKDINEPKYKLIAKAFNSYSLQRITDITMRWQNDRNKKYRLNGSTVKDLNTLPLLLNKVNSCYRGDVMYYLRSILSDSEVSKISSVDTSEMDNLFIIAPSKHMNNRDSKIKISVLKPRTEDPLICSLTPHGFMVFSKWGKEAEDEAFKKYENLFETLKRK